MILGLAPQTCSKIINKNINFIRRPDSDSTFHPANISLIGRVKSYKMYDPCTYDEDWTSNN